MRKLDRTRDFGTFKGAPYQPEGCDRIAVYQQDGRFFDVQDREIVPGVSLAAAREQKQQANRHRTEAATELLAHADKLPPAAFKSMAKIVLGAKACPSKKADIVAALEAIITRSKAAEAAALDEEDAKPVQADRTVPPAGKVPEVNGHKGLSFASMTGAKPEAPRRAAPAAKPQPAKAAPPPAPQVNLAGWARGEAEYPFHAIRRSIEERLGVAVTDATAALEALIDKGVVAFKDARKDLLPPAAVEVEDQVDA